MARSMDIASFEPGDGVLNEQLRRKLNGNFRRVCEMVGTESPAVVSSDVVDDVMSRVPTVVNEAIEAWVSANLQTILDGSFDRAYPVGCVVVTSTSSDPRLSRGTWQQVGAGRYVRSAGNGVPVMSEGGSGEHLLSRDEMPDPCFNNAIQAGTGEVGFNVMQPYYQSEQRPVPIEPEYVALLFYRRVA